MQEILKGRALSIDRLIEERARPVVKAFYFVIMLRLDGSEKSLQEIYRWYLVENKCILSL